jgi:hypothetical protein
MPTARFSLLIMAWESLTISLTTNPPALGCESCIGRKAGELCLLCRLDVLVRMGGRSHLLSTQNCADRKVRLPARKWRASCLRLSRIIRQRLSRWGHSLFPMVDLPSCTIRTVLSLRWTTVWVACISTAARRKLCVSYIARAKRSPVRRSRRINTVVRDRRRFNPSITRIGLKMVKQVFHELTLVRQQIRPKLSDTIWLGFEQAASGGWALPTSAYPFMHHPHHPDTPRMPKIYPRQPFFMPQTQSHHRQSASELWHIRQQYLQLLVAR